MKAIIKYNSQKTYWRYAFVLLLIGLLDFNSVLGQIKDPVKWNYAIRQKAEKYEIYIRAVIQPGWHIYAQSQPDGAVGKPTNISFTDSKGKKYNGILKESGVKEIQKIEELNILQYCYAGRVDFIKILQVPREAFPLNCAVEYMACNDQECLPVTTRTFKVLLPQ